MKPLPPDNELFDAINYVDTKNGNKIHSPDPEFNKCGYCDKQTAPELPSCCWDCYEEYCMEKFPEPVAEARLNVKPPIHTNEITTSWGPISKALWKKDEEEFMGEDYEPIFPKP